MQNVTSIVGYEAANAVLVAVTGFGSIWRHRLGTEAGRGRLSLPVYYNTTGVMVNGHVRQRPQICGYARFDAVGGFDPNHVSRMINRVFECTEPCVWMGCNKLLFKRIVQANHDPELYLALAQSVLYGNLQIGQQGWRSSDAWVLSFSEGGGQQEALLLLRPGGWIRTNLGKLMIMTEGQAGCEARLMLCGDNCVESHHALP